jgi:hypothetical protein
LLSQPVRLSRPVGPERRRAEWRGTGQSLRADSDFSL